MGAVGGLGGNGNGVTVPTSETDGLSIGGVDVLMAGMNVDGSERDVVGVSGGNGNDVSIPPPVNDALSPPAMIGGGVGITTDSVPVLGLSVVGEILPPLDMPPSPLSTPEPVPPTQRYCKLPLDASGMQTAGRGQQGFTPEQG